MPYTYIVQCSDDSYYVGSTWDLEQRVAEHNSPDLGAAYTRARQPVHLVWSAEYRSIQQAFDFEKRVQGWSRKKREALIRGEWTALPELSKRKAVQERLAAERADEDDVAESG